MPIPALSGVGVSGKAVGLSPIALVGTDSAGGTLTSETLTYPNDTSEGDLVIVAMFTEVGGQTHNTPTGYTQEIYEDTTVSGFSFTSTVHSYVAQAGDGGSSDTFSTSDGNNLIVIMAVFTNVDTSATAINDTAVNAGNNTSPSLASGDVIVYVMSEDHSGGSTDVSPGTGTLAVRLNTTEGQLALAWHDDVSASCTWSNVAGTYQAHALSVSFTNG